MKEIMVPCYIKGRPSTHKLVVGDGCRDERGPADAQVAWCAARDIVIGPDLLKNLSALRDLALAKGVSFEELVVLAYMIASKRNEEGKKGGSNTGSTSTGA